MNPGQFATHDNQSRRRNINTSIPERLNISGRLPPVLALLRSSTRSPPIRRTYDVRYSSRASVVYYRTVAVSTTCPLSTSSLSRANINENSRRDSSALRNRFVITYLEFCKYTTQQKRQSDISFVRRIRVYKCVRARVCVRRIISRSAGRTLAPSRRTRSSQSEKY